jgi:hypothetical protein
MRRIEVRAGRARARPREDVPVDHEEREEAAVCAVCGADVSDAENPFVFGTENVLCSECALARGGRYDVERDVWETAPDLTGLPDEAYGAAPHERRRR